MGMLNLFSRNPDDHHSIVPGKVKGPCAILLDHGIDPAGLKFTFSEDGFVTVTGRARDEFERDRICEVIAEMPLIEGVRNNLIIDESDSATRPGNQNSSGSGAGTGGESHSLPRTGFADEQLRQAANTEFKQAG